jgi:hypothetical protein
MFARFQVRAPKVLIGLLKLAPRFWFWLASALIEKREPVP